MQLAIAIGSLKGGVGVSTLARTMAVFLAQVGKRTALVDLHGGLAGIEAFSGLEEFALTRSDKGFVVARSGLQNLELQFATGEAEGLWAQVWQQLGRSEFEVLIADLRLDGSATASAVMRACQVRLLVTRPDPTSVHELYACASALVEDEVLARIGKGRAGREVLTAVNRRSEWLAGFASPRDLVDLGGEGAVREAVVEVVRGRRIGVVVNHVQEQEDFELGAAIESVGARVLCLPLVDLGHVEHDEAIEAALRRRIPLLVHMPFSKGGHDVEALARRILSSPDLDRVGSRVRPILPGEKENHYEALEVDRGSGEHEIRRAYRRIQEIYGGATPATIHMNRLDVVEGILERAGKAQRVLLDRGTKREYDRKLVRDEGSTAALARSADARAQAPAINRIAAPGTGATSAGKTDVPREGQGVSGTWLAAERERRGISLEQMSGVSKISASYLGAIEREAFDELPAPVYVRGFLTAYSRTLGLDADVVVRAYLELMRSRRG